MTNKPKKRDHTSRVPGFYKRSLAERAAFAAQWGGLSPQEQTTLVGVNGLSATQADNMIENVVGTYALPLAVATNFLINDQDYLLPMVVEEPSVVAAISNAAKLFRESGGFHTSSDDPVMIGQIQVLDVTDVYAAAGAVNQHKQELMQEADRVGGSIVRRGGALAIFVCVRYKERQSAICWLCMCYLMRVTQWARMLLTRLLSIWPR